MANRPRTAPRAPALAPLAVLTAGAAGAAYLYGTNPHEPGHWLPGCPLRALTGLLCPGCGGTRMAYDVLHGHFATAWHDNALLLAASPFVLLLLGRWLYEGLRGRRWRPAPSPRTQLALLSAAAVWTVLRNVF
ncbi:DUF2752 domain-containing protein [Streptomyces sp. NPDC016845]|uniref:DUF2752 domain-containing protein n=1 Tax=Streptomyces sp. NPDC016845 TaxID=3364972 RepID=UPI0037AC57CA